MGSRTGLLWASCAGLVLYGAGCTKDAEDDTEACLFDCADDTAEPGECPLDEVIECDPTAQDCDEGQKCTAWMELSPSSWDANRCVCLAGEGTLGDTCTVDMADTWEDDCALGFICMFETCWALCDPEDPLASCDARGAANHTCIAFNEGVLPVCVQNCDPLAPVCGEGSGCYQNPANTFTCVPYSGPDEDTEGETCQHINVCTPGQVCAGLDIDDPESEGVCKPVCDTTGDGSECSEGDVCTPFYGEETPPEGYAAVGVCLAE